MKYLGGILLSVLFITAITQPVFARSGCCSSHDGVRSDGCGCNDGTSLSATCAPYYQCSAPEPEPTYTTYTAPAPLPPSYEQTYNGVTYHSESEYNTAVAAAEKATFETNHKQAIKDSFQSILLRTASETEVNTWFNYSRDITEINQALMATNEYKGIQQEAAEETVEPQPDPVLTTQLATLVEAQPEKKDSSPVVSAIVMFILLNMFMAIVGLPMVGLGWVINKIKK